MSDFYLEGFTAASKGRSKSDCPYNFCSDNSMPYGQWMKGFTDALTCNVGL